ncbi:MAG: PKD domain-containing protein [Thermoplasmatales archaeon]|nr:MAG: PKD domain-containing protein [Thermoplasmatales archaeon]
MKNNIKKNILYFKTIFVTIVLLVTTFSVFAIAESDNSYNKIIKTYSFDKPLIQQMIINGYNYDRILLQNSPGDGNPGDYKLPVHGVNLLLNPGAEITDIEVTPGQRVFLGSGYNVELVREPVALSDIDSDASTVLNELVSHPSKPYPDTLYTEVGTHSFRGYEILVLLLHPVQYIPESGTLYYFTDITVSVTIIENNQRNPLFRNMEKDEIEVAKKVDNPLAVRLYTENIAHPLSPGAYDLLILTTNELKDSFQPLKDAHDANGIATKIKTLRDISPIPGLVTPKNIRNFIRGEYRKSGMQYVLIGGDDDIIPVRQLWVQAWWNGQSTFMPSDLYYACLDGPYNSDGDDQWGERNDGEDEGDVDLISEVYVGRACVGDTTEVDNFVEKTKAYMDTGGYDDGTTVLVGEYLWSGPDTWGGDYMDELIDGSSANSYTTVGIPSNKYSFDKLYDKNWSGKNWPKSEIKNRINNGARVINHLGHSSYGYNMKMGNSDVSGLKNDELCFVYSQGCMAGGFDYEDDSIAEYFTVKTDNAAFAVIMNARYGWGVVGSTDGPSQRFHREFWDAVFGENITEIGKANQDSKEDILFRINYPCMRWCYYQLSLFGDPTLAFFNIENHPPDKPTKPSGVKKGTTGNEYSFNTITTDQDGDLIYYKWDFGDGSFSDWLGPFSSGEEVNVSHEWSRLGIYNVKVKARDEHRAESDWSNPLIVSMPIYQNFPMFKPVFEFLEKYFSHLYSLLDKIIF